MTNPIQTSNIQSTSYQLPNGVVHVAARITQAFAATGVFFSLTAIPLNISLLFSGGSFLLNGVPIVLRAIEAVMWYDAAKIASNIASIFPSTALIDFANSSIGEKAAHYVKITEEFFSLPKEILAKAENPKSAEIITSGTLVSYHGNSYLNDFLEMKH